MPENERKKSKQPSKAAAVSKKQNIFSNNERNSAKRSSNKTNEEADEWEQEVVQDNAGKKIDFKEVRNERMSWGLQFYE